MLAKTWLASSIGKAVENFKSWRSSLHSVVVMLLVLESAFHLKEDVPLILVSSPSPLKFSVLSATPEIPMRIQS